MSDTIEGVALCSPHKGALAVALGIKAAGVVYYVTWNDRKTVKIGTTTSPVQRFRELERTAGAAVTALAAYPGGHIEERAQHRRFHHLLVAGQREIFRMAPELDEHIKAVEDTWPEWRKLLSQVERDCSYSRMRVPTT